MEKEIEIVNNLRFEQIYIDNKWKGRVTKKQEEAIRDVLAEYKRLKKEELEE